MGGYGSGRPWTAPYTAEQVEATRIQDVKRSLGLHYPEHTQLSFAGRPVELVWTACHFGGHRPWFLCPRCRRRAGRLFFLRSEVGCRECFRLPYESQREVAIHRSIRRERKIRLRLGGGPSICDPVPPKPRGMHWNTYFRLATSIDQAFTQTVKGLKDLAP